MVEYGGWEEEFFTRKGALNFAFEEARHTRADALEIRRYRKGRWEHVQRVFSTAYGEKLLKEEEAQGG
jgi:hypothetical protein